MQIILDVHEFKALFGHLASTGVPLPSVQFVSPPASADEPAAPPPTGASERKGPGRPRKAAEAPQNPPADKSPAEAPEAAPEVPNASPAPASPAPDLSAAVAKIAADAGAASAPSAEPAGDVTPEMFREKLQEYFRILSTKPWQAHCAKPENGGPFKSIGQILNAAEGETADTVKHRIARFYQIMLDDLAKAAADKAAAKAAG